MNSRRRERQRDVEILERRVQCSDRHRISLGGDTGIVGEDVTRFFRPDVVTAWNEFETIPAGVVSRREIASRRSIRLHPIHNGYGSHHSTRRGCAVREYDSPADADGFLCNWCLK